MMLMIPMRNNILLFRNADEPMHQKDNLEIEEQERIYARARDVLDIGAPSLREKHQVNSF